ncbi:MULTISPECIES: TatD family hydrolase [Francisella]|uniref:TatD family deoxyribonuclease n=1 Tax=Francisella opportunistica TaxID=2016517 RepID=A0A345JRN0_9GAMM|nr:MULTISPECIES: TatD family hydrolase [Francisella]APC91711.1 Putative deoxyribonuclease YjjV [Francisella sp. MA067296]AXH29976.1 TatD family deoxyribonuclease [Francisella opportunistica]AXH31622.1 TatD family deoxyribonuclease [Francisella opportunistica]AXH33267.1 TatD family deoxyribonuclease [Francisella opportunistica]
MFIDTHCHLDFDIFDKTRQKILQNCNKLGVNYFINPATQRSNWNKLIEINRQFSKITVCFGLHPVFIDKHTHTNLKDLESYSLDYPTKLIGEIGLDKRLKNFDKQLEFFSAQITIAKNLDKQVIIHAVKSHNEIIKIIKDLKFQNGGIIHAFNANYDIAQKYIDLGFKLGIGGIISHPQTKLKQTLQKIKPQNIVLETDSPDMQLYNSSDNINTPENIPKIFELISNIYQTNPDILKQQIYTTSLEFI